MVGGLSLCNYLSLVVLYDSRHPMFNMDTCKTFTRAGVNKLQPVGQILLPHDIVKKFYWNITTHSFVFVRGSFHATRAELSSYGREDIDHKA